ncbi:uncharacterized protein Dwil_GK27584 [Drosophila willistoni]|uniref:Adenylate kinase n=1 Tax=Drosophila willistoni TaxID=7260 RepID=A0A0Q9WSG1_DROWI|nr:adenylate kinase isoenzyme 1-like [Drosophila willistoni]KRF99040.1 uncharacterized protein Dwil_GK27584 [Drosophila willistoni]
MAPPILWIIGGPSSGKGTQCEKIVGKYGFTHINPDEIVNREIEAKSASGKKFEGLRSQGQEVPFDEILPFIEKLMMEQRGGIKGFVIDGYPHTLAEANLMEQSLGSPDMIIALEILPESAGARAQSSSGGAPRHSQSTYKRNAKSIFEQYSDKLVQIDGERDVDQIFEDIVPNIDLLMKNRGGNRLPIER